MGFSFCPPPPNGLLQPEENPNYSTQQQKSVVTGG
jgi:hypothetical protein